ncbi:MAG: acetylxylan esterase [Candidatus Symbiothrix sp.]|nr:acetylxylan esterase [Candidatus Symbiothrix sp.]
MKNRRIILICLMAFIGLLPNKQTIIAQNNFNALPWNQSLAYNAYLMRTVHQQYLQRDETINRAFKTKESMQAYIDACRRHYRSIAGPFPPKSALNVKIAASYETAGIRVENIIFESLPGRYVTANLYLPAKFSGKIPAVLEFCGHGINGKVSSSPTAPVLALNGIAVLVIDPLGQGERLQLIDEKGNALTRGATTEHTLLNAGLNLLGTSLAAQEFWDNHRALDYLLTRSDIDGDKIGVFGSSGGGTQAAYFVGLDDRIRAAAICSYFSLRERTLELQGASDGCQHIPYEGREQLELTDFALMAAPKPVLILSGKYDFVDLWGAQQGFIQLQKAYTALGIPNRVDMLTVETGHGLGEEKRKRLVFWFRQWLLDKAEMLTNTFPSPLDLSKLYCTPSHQVNTAFENAGSLMQENSRQAEALEMQRRTFQEQGKVAVRKKAEELLGLSNAAPLSIVPGRQEAGRGYEQYKFQLIREGEMPVPCVVIVPEKANEKSLVRLVLSESGKNAFFNEFTNITSALTDGTILVAADLRGIGETADPPFYNDAKYWNFEYRNAMISMHIGKPILGQRVQDILSLLDFCAVQKELKGHPVHVRTGGLYGPAVVHAAFLDNRIASAEITRSISSWKTYLSDPLQYDMYSNVLYGVLNYYDLPDLVRLSGNRVRYIDTPALPVQANITKEKALETMRKATRYMVEKVGYRGAYVWAYLPDLSRRWGELEAYPTMGWIQPPGTGSVGHLFLDAYHATGDEYYYDAACEVARALIGAQLPCGGWNYMLDYAGENSLKQWYATIGKQAWRMEEFQHYYGNATFDDGVTICAAEFLLRIYTEKNDFAFRPALEKVIRFVLESQYPSGGWPQRYPLMYDHVFRGKPDYSSFITLNDDVCLENIEFLIQCSQALGLDNVKEPITRAMDLLIALQQAPPYAGWADQYTVADLKPAQARSYEPRGVNVSTTVEMIDLLMKYYRLTGEEKFLSGIPAAIRFLESLKLSEADIKRSGRTLRSADERLVPRYIDSETGIPQYIHRKGSNVENGYYYFDQDITNTVSHLSSFTFINIPRLWKAYEEIKRILVEELIKDSPLASGKTILLPRYYSRIPVIREDTEIREIVETLTPEGSWLTPLTMTSYPYKACPELPPSEETKYASTRVGDEYDTSTFSMLEKPVLGITTTSYMSNMMKLIIYIEK